MQSKEQEQGNTINNLLKRRIITMLPVLGDGNCIATSLIGGILDSFFQEHISYESALIQDLINMAVISRDFLSIDPVTIRDICANSLYQNQNRKFSNMYNANDVDDLLGYPLNGPQQLFRNPVNSADLFLKIFTSLFTVNVVLYTNDGRRPPFANIYWSTHPSAEEEAKMIFIEHIYTRGIANHFNPLVYDKEKIYHLMKPFLDGSETHQEFVDDFTHSFIEGQRNLFAHFDSKKQSIPKPDAQWIRIDGLSNNIPQKSNKMSRINDLEEQISKYNKINIAKTNQLLSFATEAKELKKIIIPLLDKPCASKFLIEGNMPPMESSISDKTNNFFDNIIKFMETQSEMISVDFKINGNQMRNELAELQKLK